MRAIVHHRHGSPEVLRLEDVPEPRLVRDDGVLVKVAATSINSWDWDLLRGYLAARRTPRHPVLGADVAGTVEAVGPAVTRFRPGDRVYGDLSRDGWGGLGEYVCPRERALAPMPAGLTFEQAAAVPQAAVLALQGLRYGGELGAAVLINGAGGGVGTFAVQMAKAEGAAVTAVDRDSKLDLLRTLGAADVVDYRAESFADRRDRYDRIVDVLLRGSVVARSRALRAGGIYAVIGGTIPRLLQTVAVGRLLRGRRAALVIHRPGAGPLAEVTRLIESGAVKPVLDGTYALEDARAAFERFGSGEFRGKVVISHGA